MLGRCRPAERASARLVLALAGALSLGVAAVPLGLLVRSAWPPLLSLDTGATAAAERAVAGSAPLLTAARAVTLAGDPSLLWLLTVVVAGALAATGHRRLALFVLVVRLGAQLLSTGLKLAFDRARPVFEQPVDAALGGSFPSGHALGSAAVWTALAVLARALVARRAGAVLLLAAGLVAASVAASRVLLGVHYVSDVLGGLLLGVGWTALCTALFVAWRREEGRPVDALSIDGVEDGVSPELRR